MSNSVSAAKGSSKMPDLPASLAAEQRGDIAILRLNRAQKRNALNDEIVLGL